MISYIMTRQILFLMTAILVLGVSTTAFANAEEHIVNVDGNHQYWIDIDSSQR